jgi:DNA-binding IscR family transcriptional regulator
MAGAGPITSAELAAKSNTSERYVREWLNANAASGFVT